MKFFNLTFLLFSVSLQGCLWAEFDGSLSELSSLNDSAVLVYQTSLSDETIELPLDGDPSFIYNFIVDWGDGTPIQTVSSATDPNRFHTYLNPGNYTVTMDGLAQAMESKCVPGAPFINNLISVPNLGDMGWTSMRGAFRNCENLTTVEGGEFSQVTTMASMFASAINATPNTSNWNTSNVVDMSSMFFGARSANPDVSNWNTGRVINMLQMFAAAILANPNVSNWDVSNVESTTSMFALATSAIPDTSRWNTSSLVNASAMFSFATSANPDVSGWDTSNLTTIFQIFGNASSAAPNVTNWDTANIRDMDEAFVGIAGDPDVTNWDTSNVTDMRRMFSNATNANPNVSNWDFSSIPVSSGPGISPVSDLFRNTNISNINYSNFLIRLEQTTSHTGRHQIGSVNAQYESRATSARNTLISRGSNIIDLGPE